MRIKKDSSNYAASGVVRRYFRQDPGTPETEVSRHRGQRRRKSKSCEHDFVLVREEHFGAPFHYTWAKLRCRRCHGEHYIDGAQIPQFKRGLLHAKTLRPHNWTLVREYGLDKVYFPYGVIECPCGERRFLFGGELRRFKQLAELAEPFRTRMLADYIPPDPDREWIGP